MDVKEARNFAKEIFKNTYKIEVQLLDGGTLPCKAYPSDAGFDVFATEDVCLRFGEVIKTPLNFRMKLPVGSWARVETKSGLGSKGMLVFAGVIDRNYRNVPHVIATNLNKEEPIVVRKGEKIAQITMNPHGEDYYIEQVDKVDTDTDRGAGGFGSTGK